MAATTSRSSWRDSAEGRSRSHSARSRSGPRWRTVDRFTGAFVGGRQRSRQAPGSTAALNILPLVAERQARSLDERRRGAARDLTALLRFSQEERLTRVRRANSRFRGVLLARMVLETAERHIPAEPKRVYELAETAQTVLSRTPAGEGVADLCARAAIYMGNALRAQGDLKAADRHFVSARHVIVHNGVTDPMVIAEVDWFEGTLRKDQRRFDEAEELLLRAVTFYRLAGEEGRAAYPLVTLGLLLADRQDHREARDAFLQALPLIDPAKDARLYCYAQHNLIRTLCQLGHYSAAAEALAVSRDLYRQHPDLYTRSRLAWLEGMIAAGLGHLDEAEAAFLSVRRHFLEEGNGYDAAMLLAEAIRKVGTDPVKLRDAIEEGVAGTLRLMKHLNMIDDAPAKWGFHTPGSHLEPLSSVVSSARTAR